MAELVANASKTAANAVAKPAAAAPAAAPEIALPDINTLQNAFKLSLNEDKPIMTDYWVPSLKKEVIIGVRETKDSKEKLLVKSEDEYTSPISKIFKVGTQYITMTENSIYIVDAGIATKKIS
jgi:hypothetical protein